MRRKQEGPELPGELCTAFHFFPVTSFYSPLSSMSQARRWSWRRKCLELQEGTSTSRGTLRERGPSCELHEAHQDQFHGPVPLFVQAPVSIQMRDALIESSPAERNLGLLVNERLDMSQERALATQKAKKAWPAGEGRWFSPLLWCCGVQCPALGFPVQEGHGPVRAGPGEAMKMVRGMEHISCEDRLWELGFTLDKRRFWGDLIVTVVFLYKKGIYKKDGERVY